MKNRILALSGLIALIGAGTTYAVLPQSSSAAPTPPVTAPAPEGHPEMVAALNALEQAEDHLQKAQHDYDGHREKAMDLTQRAIIEVKLGIQSDRH